MADRFRPSNSNKVYFCTIAILYVTLFLFAGELTPYRLGHLTGTLLTMFLVSWLFAWLVWRVGGRGKRGGAWTFNLVLTVVLIGQFGQLARRAEIDRQVIELQTHKAQFKQDLSSADTGQQQSAAYREFSDSVIGNLDAMQMAASGDEKKIYGILGELTKKSQAEALAWSRSFDSVQDERILDYMLLDSDEEFAYQKDTVKQYLESTQAYKEASVDFLRALRSRMAEFHDNEIAKGVIVGAQGSYERVNTTLQPLLAAHYGYGEEMIRYLDLLEQNRERWFVEGESIYITDETLRDRYNEVVDSIGKIEEQLNSLADRHKDNL